VILPTVTSCIECQLDMHAPRETVPLCTLATIPRQPQHCIEWARIMAWEAERKGTAEVCFMDRANLTR
jgi:NEDD8-activating enzyme E1